MFFVAFFFFFLSLSFRYRFSLLFFPVIISLPLLVSSRTLTRGTVGDKSFGGKGSKVLAMAVFVFFFHIRRDPRIRVVKKKKHENLGALIVDSWECFQVPPPRL